MSEASQFIIEEKKRMEKEIERAVRGFHNKTGLLPSAIDISTYTNLNMGGDSNRILGSINTEIKI